MNFSIVLICRNESRTIPRLLASLKEFQQRGGKVILVDTGSTDDSASIARNLGVEVHEVGERFLFTIDKDLAKEINGRFIFGEEQPLVKEGDRLFDYAKARNFAASLSPTDMVAMPDCDEEYTRFDLDAVQAKINEGVGQLEYEFVFAHDEHGNEIVKFRHCKFYNRTQLHWVGVVHEVLAGTATRAYLPPEIIKLEHWQQPSDHRRRYLTGLALDCFQNPNNDRNSHYLAREMLYTGRYKSAYQEFERHIAMNGWFTEATQSVLFQGECAFYLGNEDLAVKKWHEAIARDSSRREPWMRLAHHFHKKDDKQRAAAYAMAATTIPWSDFYANNANHYRHEPHEILYWALWWLGDRKGSFQHWQKARDFFPENEKYRRDSVFYLDFLNPKVSIVIPTLGREEQLTNLVNSLPETTEWTNFEVIVERDSFEDRSGAPKTVKKGVDRSTGDFVCFLGNDCRPEKGFLRRALEKMYQSFPYADGLVGLNDGIWTKGELATHWLASKRLLPHLDGEFFHTGYHHAGCDNELTGRCQLMGKYVWAEDARIAHDHPVKKGWHDVDKVHELAYSRVREDRELLKQRARQFGFDHLLV
jgi:glycosyltransferase involved in cell wall biosynthesis